MSVLKRRVGQQRKGVEKGGGRVAKEDVQFQDGWCLEEQKAYEE